MTPELATTLALLIPAMPLLASLLIVVLGKKFPADLIGIGAMGVSLAMAITLILSHGTSIGAAREFEWFTVGDITWQVGVAIDGLTLALLGVVTLVSFLVHLFAKGYMHGDDRYTEFYRMLGFFTFSMLLLVVSDNLITLFISWELMGLASYKLIGHFFKKRSAQLACKKAFMTTRVGDIGFFLALLAIYQFTGSLQFDEIFARLDLIPDTARTWIALGLFMGAMGKSAQFPLHIWLPDAMEGPTPVSALIHAATMVAAGVYLVGRMYTVIVLSPEALLVISSVGCFTALFAATIAFTQTDIKAVLAYSTISQLGFMFTALGTGTNFGWKAGLFHLVTHAFFKACLFLGSGSVIHACHHEQDMTKMGGLRKKMPITHAAYLISCLSIAGFPFTAGFMSKDMILQALWMGNGQYDMAYKVIFFVLAAAALMTAAYMFRGFLLPFYGKPRDHHVYDHAHESPLNMTIPLIVLSVLAVASGYWWAGAFLDIGADSTMAAWVGGTTGWFDPDGDAAHHAHSMALIASSIVMTSGIGLACVWYLTGEFGAGLRKRMRAAIAPLYRAASKLYWVDDVVEYLLIVPSKFLAQLIAWIDSTLLDRGVVDNAGVATMAGSDASGWADDALVDGAVNLAGDTAWSGGGLLARWQTGRIRNYLFGAVGTAAFVAVIVLYMSGS